MRFHQFCAPLAFCLALAGCANGNTDLAQGLNVSWSAGAAKRIVMVDPDVELSELTMGGITEARADWTATGKTFVRDDIISTLAAKGIDVAAADPPTDPREVQLVKLHGAVGASIFLNTLLQLPTKKKNFDWTLGPGVSALRDHYKGDYALFVYIRDSYSSGGRILLQLGAAALGVGVSGGQQVGFASLVDLRTGQIVWFNRLGNATGSLKDAKGATTTVTRLLSGLPL